MLQQFDIFGLPISLRYNNLQIHKTFYGSLFTILITLLIIAYSYQIADQCFGYKNPNVIYQENIVEQPSPLTLDSQHYTLAMGIQDSTLVHILDESIYYLDVSILSTQKTFNNTTNEYVQTTTQTSIQMVPCTLEHFQVQGTLPYFQALQYQSLYCFPLNQNITIEGQFGASVYTRLYIQVKTCQSASGCADPTVIQQKLSNVAFQLYYVNYAIQQTDKDNPLQPIVQNTFWQSSITQFKNINVYFRKTTVSSDFGLFTSSYTYNNRGVYSYDRETILTKTDNKMYEMYIGLEKNKESEYIRNYLKLYSGISQIGGIYNVLFLIGCILCFPFSRVSFEQNLMSSMFHFEKKREETKCSIQMKGDQNISSRQTLNQQLFSTTTQPKLTNQDWNNIELDYNLQSPLEERKKKKTNIPYINKNEVKRKNQLDSMDSMHTTQNQFLFNTQNEKYNLNNLNNTNISGVLTANMNNFQVPHTQQPLQPTQAEYVVGIRRIREIFTSSIYTSYNRIKLTFWGLINDKIIGSLRRSQPHCKMINYGIKRLYDQMDISYIMKKLIEIEKLKHLLLSENQIKLFDFIPKPTLYLQDFEEDLKRKTPLKTQPTQPSKSTYPNQSATPQIEKYFRQPQLSLLKEDLRNEDQKAKDAEDAFNQIFKIGKSQSIVDKRLIQLLDVELISDSPTNSQNKMINATPLSHHTQQTQQSQQSQQTQQQTFQFGDTVDNIITHNGMNHIKENHADNKNIFELPYSKSRLSNQSEQKQVQQQLQQQPSQYSSSQKPKLRLFSNQTTINLQNNDDDN